jgi:hypothetical protein
MAKAVKRRPLTVEARIQSQAKACGICSKKIATGTGFFFKYFRFHLQYHTGIPAYTVHIFNHYRRRIISAIDSAVKVTN